MKSIYRPWLLPRYLLPPPTMTCYKPPLPLEVSVLWSWAITPIHSIPNNGMASY